MPFDELSNLVNDCLEKLERKSKSDFDFPKQERTYNELISLLEKKIRDDLKTSLISKYLQDFREKNFYYSKSNNKYKEFTNSVESFLGSLEQIKSKFKVLESGEIQDLDNLALTIKSQNFFNFDEKSRIETTNIITAKLISDEMISCIIETLILLEKNKALYFSNIWSPNLKSFGSLLGSTGRLPEEKSITYSFQSYNLEYILKRTIISSVFYLGHQPAHHSLFRNVDFCRSWLSGLRCSLFENSIAFIDEIKSIAKNKMQYESEKYKKQIEIDPKILQQELEVRVSQREDSAFGKPLEERRKLIISLRSKKKNAFKKIFEKLKFEIIPFDIFPKGSIEISTFLTMLRAGGVRVSCEDERRLYKIAKKFPNYQSICRGRNNFDGFVVFRFEDTDVVIVEKPSYGNATYLIKGDWEKDIIKILQLNRSLARRKYPKQVRRIIHKSEFNWLSELEVKFKYWF